MNNKLVSILLLLTVVFILFLALTPPEEVDYSKDKLDRISGAFKSKFEQLRREQMAQQQESPKQITESKNRNSANPHPDLEQENQPTILAIIYRRSSSIWFIKAKDSSDKINTISAKFKNYFLDQLTFNNKEQPDFSHLPPSMIVENSSNMRVATFKLGEVEVSVSKLEGNQDIKANIQRWMRQVNVTDESNIEVSRLEKKQAVVVRIPKT